MTAGLEGRRTSGKGRGHRWETAAGDRPKCSTTARLRAGRRHKGMGGQEEGSECVVIPDSLKLVQLLVMVINQKGQGVL